MASSSGVRAYASFFVKLLVSAGILLWLFRSIDVAAVVSRARTAHLGWVAVGLAVYGVMVLISSWRWKLLLSAQGVAAPLPTLNASWMVALFFNNFLPSNIGGDVIRIADSVALTRSRTVAAAVVLVDRAIGLGALLIIAALGSWLASTRGIDVPGKDYVWIGTLAAVLVGLPILVRPAWFLRALEPLGRLHPELLGRRIDRFGDSLRRIAEAPACIWGAALGAIIVQVLIVVFYLCIAWAIDVPLPLLAGLVVVPVSLVLQMAPVSVNGFGVREAIFVWFFRRLGLSPDAGVALSLLSTVVIMLFSMGGGLIWILRRKRGTDPVATGSADEADA